MRAREFLYEEAKPALKKLGRAFNHLEDLVFFYGSRGTMESLSHLKEIMTAEGSNSLRMKWDGNPQIYWGRETKGGPAYTCWTQRMEQRSENKQSWRLGRLYCKQKRQS
jgi:hypothetical protein